MDKHPAIEYWKLNQIEKIYQKVDFQLVNFKLVFESLEYLINCNREEFFQVLKNVYGVNYSCFQYDKVEVNEFFQVIEFFVSNRYIVNPYVFPEFLRSIVYSFCTFCKEDSLHNQLVDHFGFRNCVFKTNSISFSIEPVKISFDSCHFIPEIENNLEALKYLSFNKFSYLPNFFSDLLLKTQSLSSLSLDSPRIDFEITSLPDSLRSLSLQNISNTSKLRFNQNLEVLRLSNLHFSEDFLFNEVNKMFNLSHLNIDFLSDNNFSRLDLPNLKTLSIVDTKGRLTSLNYLNDNLEVLELYNCSNLTEITLPRNLQQLHVYSCPNLEKIIDQTTNLQNISVWFSEKFNTADIKKFS